MRLLVTLPTPEGLHLYERRAGRMRHCGFVRHPRELHHRFVRVDCPELVVLVGDRHTDWYVDTILERADLLTVPATWLRHIPRAQPTRRAAYAARVALDHRAHPLGLRLGRLRTLPLPF